MRDSIFHILFFWYPYFCLTVFLVGSLIRFDREQYSWRASSSQLLRRRRLLLPPASGLNNPSLRREIFGAR